MTISKSIHVAANGIILFLFLFFMTKYYYVDIFFISSSVDGHLVFFHALDIVNSAAMNKVVHMSF